MKKILAALIVAVGLVGGAQAQTSKIKMTVATGIDPSLAAFYIGKLGGFFERNGLDVTVNTGSSGSAMVPFLIGNQVQAVFGGESAGIQNNALDSNVVVAAEMLQVLKYMGVVGRNIDSLDGLKGKKVGVVVGSASEVFWRALLDKLNLDPKNYTVVPVEPPELMAALERGNIDGAAAYEPWLTRILTGVPNTKLLRDNEGIIHNRSFVYLNRGWAEANPVAAEAFMRALVQATNYIHSNPEEAAKQVSTFLKLDLPMTRLLMSKMNYRARMETDSIDYLKTVEKQLTQSGKLTKPVDWNRFVYSDLIKKVGAK